MKTLTPKEFDALTRLDFWIFVQRVFAELSAASYADNFHIQLLCGHVDRFRTESSVRLAIALPPRSLKSIIISVALTAWLLGHDSSLQIVCASYGQELSDKFGADTRRIMLTPWYRRLFPGTVLERQAVNHLVTTKGGQRYATSVGGPLTGIGADVIIVDDPMKAEDAFSDAERNRINDWAEATLFTRLNNKAKDRIIIVHQRLHEDDLIGHLTERAGFEMLSFPAIAQVDEVHHIPTPFGTLVHHRREGEALHPIYEPISVLIRQRTLMGTPFFDAQYLQSPTPPGGGLIKIAWFNRFDLANKPRFARIVQSWDCASKASELSDFNVCTTWGVTHQGDAYLLHVLRERLEYPELKRKVRQMAQMHTAGIVVIEDTSAGTQLIQELTREGFARIVPIKPKGDKTMRMAAQTPVIEAGRVFIPERAPWLDDLEHELTRFPKSKYDDQVDSIAQALAFIGAPSPGDAAVELMRWQWLRSYGLTDADLTTVFDCEARDRVFEVWSGRKIYRDGDGFYHATPDEWEGIRHLPGVTLVEEG